MLRIAVATGVSILIGTWINSFTGFFWMPFVFFVAGLCGAFCGGVTIFTTRGFHRVLAGLIAAISLYTLIRLVSYIGWAVNLP